MVDIYCVCGEWRRNENQWEFVVDTTKGSAMFDIAEDLKYQDLFDMVVGDFEIDCARSAVTLSFGLPLKMRLMVECSQPVFLKNDRHLRCFINLIKSNAEELIRLCVTVADLPEISIQSKSIQSKSSCNVELCEEVNPKTTNVLQTEPVSSHVDAFTLGNQQSFDRSNISSTSASAANDNTCSDASFTHENQQASGGLYVGRQFKNKSDLMLQMRKWALEFKFEFRSPWSDKTRVVLQCVDPTCSWKMRATKLSGSDFFVVKTYVDEHTCDTTYRNANHRQATSKVLGTLLSSNYGVKKQGLHPKQIMEQVKLAHGVHIGYKQAWRVKDYAQNLIRGTPEDSYLNLSKWLFQVQDKNPGTKVFLEMEANGKFKYAFLAFGQSIRGFELMRRVIAIDGTHLKGKYNGTLLVATAQDGDFSLYPLAFAIVDTETERAWVWFLRGLQLSIPDASDLVFVSDRAPAIAKALSRMYPLAHHGICRVHLLRNLQGQYAGTGLLPLVESAANAYTQQEFAAIFCDIRSQSTKLAEYLESSDFAKWARSYAPSNRYNIMTTNIAESFNSLLNLARETPVVCLLETIRLTLTTWFHERREKASKHRKLVSPNVVKMLKKRFDVAMKFDVYQVDQYEFEVKEEIRKHIVHLGERRCTCLVFDIEKIPCVHAIAAAKRSNNDENKFVDQFFLTETLIRAYAESIHPGEDLTSTNVPDSVSDYSCAPPTAKQTSGRPPKKRKRSAGEFGVPNSKSQGHKCSRCNKGGHNKTTCKSPI